MDITAAGRCIPALLIGIGLARAADLPVKQVTLYKHGIGFFEREGIAAPGDEIRLDFQTGDMNDVLKSLVVTDLGGGMINAIRYDSNETQEQRLARFPFQIGSGELLSTFLDGLKGAQLELKLAEKTATGTILGSRAVPNGADNDRRNVREQVTLLLESGDIANYDLASVTSMRLLEPRLQSQLQEYLLTLGQSRSKDKRSVYIEADAKDTRHLRVSYIAPTAIWKSSYRLTMKDQESTLEGWAIVDNTTGEDWTNVRLAVVSGRPISFISLLDTPRYGQRQVAKLPEDRAAGPEVYGGSVSPDRKHQVFGDHLAKGGGGSGEPSAGLPQEFMALRVAPSVAEKSDVSSVPGTTGETIGELFEYNFPNLVTIKRNQSAMLPFMQDKIQARKLLIYTDKDGEHPVNAAELTNRTGKTLDGGPITVYDGGAYAGEALFETLKSGDKRLIGYAVDYGTRLTDRFESADRQVREVHVRDGVLQIRFAQRQTRTYNIKNVDQKAKTLMVEVPGGDGFHIVTPKPVEQSANAFRFEARLAPSDSQTLRVELEQTQFQQEVVSDDSPDQIAEMVENKELGQNARTQLKNVLDIKRQIVSTGAMLTEIRNQLAELKADQERLRQNIDSLNRVKGQEEQVRRYSGELADNETQIAKLGDQVRTLTAQQSESNRRLRDAIDKLSF